MKRELESLGLHGVAFPGRGIGLPFERKLGVSKGGGGEQRVRRRGEGNWKEETRSIYLLNVFRAFVGGVCRVPTGNTRRLKECCRIQRGRESPRFRQDTEGSTKVASLNGITTCYVVAPTSGKETRKLTSSCIYIYTRIFFSLFPLPSFHLERVVSLGTQDRAEVGMKKKEETRINGGDESGRPILSFFSPEETAVRH